MFLHPAIILFSWAKSIRFVRISGFTFQNALDSLFGYTEEPRNEGIPPVKAHNQYTYLIWLYFAKHSKDIINIRLENDVCTSLSVE